MATYNWWLVVPFRQGLLTSTDGFFSDLAASGQPKAALLQRLDLAAALLLLAALLMHPASEHDGRRTEWGALLIFATAGLIGARYPYLCAEGLSASCRSREMHFQLPARHYVHVLSGIVEFAAITIAATQAFRRTRGEGTRVAAVYRGVVWVLLVGYPVLGACYLSDRWGVFIEPVFFLAFSAVVVGELVERTDRRRIVTT